MGTSAADADRVSVKVGDIVLLSRHATAAGRQRRVRKTSQSLRRVGQREPIAITRGGVLIYGHHRLEAAKLLGWSAIWARVFEMDEVDRLAPELLTLEQRLGHGRLQRSQRLEVLAHRAELLNRIGLALAVARREGYTP